MVVMIKHALGFVALFPAILAAQAGQASAPDITIRATTRLVQVTVVALGKRGVPARDLQRESFRVYDEGKPQQISFFSLDTPAPVPAAGEARKAGGPTAAVGPHVFSNRRDVVSGPGTSTVILIDRVNTGWNDQIRAAEAIIGFLRQTQSEDRIGIYVHWPGSLQILYEVTQDSSELVKHLAAWKPDVGETSGRASSLQGSNFIQAMSDISRPYSDSGDEDGLRRFARTASRGPNGSDSHMADRAEISLKLFGAIANHLAAIPGRKSLIWVSAGFVRSALDYPAMQDTVRLLNGANVALYAVDARGLLTLQGDATVGPVTSAAGGGGRGAGGVRVARRIARTNNVLLVRTQVPMLELSAPTGGRAFLNTNDIQGAIRTAAKEADVTYTLGFYPASPQHDGRFHRIEVKVAGRPDVSVRYRKGYVDAPDPANDSQGRTAAIRDAAWSPLDATAVALSAEVVPAGGTDHYDVRLRIDPRTLDIRPEQDRLGGRADVILVQEDHEGGQYDQVIDTLVLALKPDTYQRALTEGLEYSHALQPNPKANELRVIVRDAFSGNIGSLTIPFRAFRVRQ